MLPESGVRLVFKALVHPSRTFVSADSVDSELQALGFFLCKVGPMTLTLSAGVKLWGSSKAGAVYRCLGVGSSSNFSFISSCPHLFPNVCHLHHLTRVVKQLLGEDGAVVNWLQSRDARLGLLGWVLLCPRLRREDSGEGCCPPPGRET